MTTLWLPAPGAATEPWLARTWWALKNTWVLTRRSIARIRREPSNCSTSPSSR